MWCNEKKRDMWSSLTSWAISSDLSSFVLSLSEEGDLTTHVQIQGEYGMGCQVQA
jgi:hypothetical protein